MTYNQTLAHDKAQSVSIPRRMLNEARRVARLIEDCDYSPELVAFRLGYGFDRNKDFDEPIYGILHRGFIMVRAGLSDIDELLTITHEHCHHKFHKDYQVGEVFREQGTMWYNKEETQAELFATLSLLPYLPVDVMDVKRCYVMGALPSELEALRWGYFLSSNE